MSTHSCANLWYGIPLNLEWNPDQDLLNKLWEIFNDDDIYSDEVLETLLKDDKVLNYGVFNCYDDPQYYITTMDIESSNVDCDLINVENDLKEDERWKQVIINFFENNNIKLKEEHIKEIGWHLTCWEY